MALAHRSALLALTEIMASGHEMRRIFILTRVPRRHIVIVGICARGIAVFDTAHDHTRRVTRGIPLTKVATSTATGPSNLTHMLFLQPQDFNAIHLQIGKELLALLKVLLGVLEISLLLGSFDSNLALTSNLCFNETLSKH